jgi:hypothetical protein
MTETVSADADPVSADADLVSADGGTVSADGADAGSASVEPPGAIVSGSCPGIRGPSADVGQYPLWVKSRH